MLAALIVVAGGAICAAGAEDGPAPLPSITRQALFTLVGTLYNLDPQLLESIAEVESNDNPRAVSPKGALGFMQLLPDTAYQFGVNDPFEPAQSVLGAARFLSDIRQRQLTQHEFSADLPTLLAAYNAGEGAVEQYRGVPPYPETKQYIKRVLWLYLFGVPPERATTPIALPTQASAPPIPVNRAPAQPSSRLSLGSAQGGLSDRELLERLADLRRERRSVK